MSDTVVVREDVITVVTATEQGPPGPGLLSTDQLPEGDTNKYDKHFEQAFTNQSTVTVNHNLGKKPSVTVIDTAGDQCIGDIRHVNANSLILSFSASFSGTVIVN